MTAITALRRELAQTDMQITVLECPLEQIVIVKFIRPRARGKNYDPHAAGYCAAHPIAESGQRYPRKLALTHLGDDDSAGFQDEIAIGYLAPVKLYRALLNHAEALRGAGSQTGLL